MSELRAKDFTAFFGELYKDADGKPLKPYSWQRRLAHRVCDGEWPKVIDVPTASGKTACLDVAVFALAVQASRPPVDRTVSRRIFFVVNRRVIVDQAHERARHMAKALAKADAGSVLHQVAESLRSLGGDKKVPLDVATLRGGIVRDNRWARSITQPTIITSTVDQVGSRLLFRGYGVSESGRPVHAALVAHDSTILLDEAHISQPFVESIENVWGYRGDNWADEPIKTPFHFVKMTATPSDGESDAIKLDDEDRKALHPRHGRPKPVQLHVASKAKGKGETPLKELAAELVVKAVELQDGPRRNIAVIVNRVATAHAVYGTLQGHFRTKNGDCEPIALVELAIGRMRPLDRDDMTSFIDKRLRASTEAPADERPMFVVATQCLEVGADYDFDAMVCECASLDALRQRFGRLNRGGSQIEARGCVVIRADQVADEDDPIYGSALTKTWQWLQEAAVNGSVDFGVNAINARIEGIDTAKLMAPTVSAPVMFPAYVDAWAQTSPTPMPDPDVSLFLHGAKESDADVNVCWRADLSDKQDEAAWRQIVSLCPPTSPECMPVPIGVMRAWLKNQSTADEQRSDILEPVTTPDSEDKEDGAPGIAIAWRGIGKAADGQERTRFIHTAAELRPGDTIVLRAQDGAWRDLGHVPNVRVDANEHGVTPEAQRTRQIDIAERAKINACAQAIIRLHPDLWPDWPESDEHDELRRLSQNDWESPTATQLKKLVKAAIKGLPDDHWKKVRTALARSGWKFARYPGGRGLVLWSPTRLEDLVDATDEAMIPSLDDGDDELSRLQGKKPVSLNDHLQHVRQELDGALASLPLADYCEALTLAADLHDIGKADERFQAYLLSSDLCCASAQPGIWAKHPDSPATYRQHLLATEKSGRPEGFRHEMLSMQLAKRRDDLLPSDEWRRQLVLHLIAAHHGYARPFAPVVIDEHPPDVAVEVGETIFTASADDRRLAIPPHRLDSGVAERFWTLTRRVGWWGLAYLEAVLRLADQRASEKEQLGSYGASQSMPEAVSP